MEEANNIILVLSVLLLIISVVGTALLLEKISVGTTVPTVQTTQRGEVKLTILPPPNSVSTTGHIGLNILPGEEK